VEVLGGKINERPTGEYHMYEDADINSMNTNEEGEKKPEDEYDEEDAHQGMQCGTH
jgi:hypothetical protein